jgi:hypothetical protein
MLQAVRETTDEGRQVAVYSTVSGEIMYVVPPGRVFEGYASARNGSGGITINGAVIPMDVQSTGANSIPFPLTLHPETIVRSQGTNGVAIWGVEK